MAKVLVNYYEPIIVDTMEDYTLPNTSVKMVKITGYIMNQNYTEMLNEETKLYDLKENPQAKPITIIVNPNRIIEYIED